MQQKQNVDDDKAQVPEHNLMQQVCKEQKISLTELQILCAIDATLIILPLSEKQLDPEIFEKDYGFSQEEMREEINNLRSKLRKL